MSIFSVGSGMVKTNIYNKDERKTMRRQTAF
jgi:hypothetical protein